MAAERGRCARCGAPLPPGAKSCPACQSPVGSTPPPAKPQPAPPADGPSNGSAAGSEITRRLARIQQWQDASGALSVTLPTLPRWAEEAARRSPTSEAWLDVLRGVERLAQRSVVQALEAWEKRTKNRLARLEAYSVDSRLERDQIDDVLHFARTGEISQALATFQQVDRVVTLKERHLDQARDELERLVSLLRDMEALGLPPPHDPGELASDLEAELRSGRLASLKQQLRALRLQTMNRLKSGLAEYVGQYGEFLVRERAEGIPVELEAAELARGARAFAKGHPEEALRRLRILAQVHGGGPARHRRGGPTTGPGSTTEGARRA